MNVYTFFIARGMVKKDHKSLFLSNVFMHPFGRDHANKSWRIAARRAIDPLLAGSRQDQKRACLDELSIKRVDVVNFLPDRALRDRGRVYLFELFERVYLVHAKGLCNRLRRVYAPR